MLSDRLAGLASAGFGFSWISYTNRRIMRIRQRPARAIPITEFYVLIKQMTHLSRVKFVDGIFLYEFSAPVLV